MISIVSDNNYISLTNIARPRDEFHTDDIINNWMRNANIF